MAYAGDDNEGDGYLEPAEITVQDHPVFTISTPEQSTVSPTNYEQLTPASVPSSNRDPRLYASLYNNAGRSPNYINVV